MLSFTAEEIGSIPRMGDARGAASRGEGEVWAPIHYSERSYPQDYLTLKICYGRFGTSQSEGRTSSATTREKHAKTRGTLPRLTNDTPQLAAN